MLKSNYLSSVLLKNSLFSSINFNGKFEIQLAGMKYYPPPKPIDKSEWPEYRKLKLVDKQPTYETSRFPRMMKMLKFLRGPEEVHTDLIYKGFGVKALLGGRMKFQHFEAVRRLLLKKIDTERMFAMWRVEPPWQPLSKKSIGKRMGGGKGAIHHYATPVKAERIIIEICGDIHPLEAKSILVPVAEILPFAARFVSQESLEKEREREKWMEENNLNPYTMEYVIRNNMGGCSHWLSPYDYKWFGKYK